MVKKVSTRPSRRRPNRDDDEVPFVIAYDLYETSLQKLTDEEVATVALALLALLPGDDRSSAWEEAARIDAISQRHSI